MNALWDKWFFGDVQMNMPMKLPYRRLKFEMSQSSDAKRLSKAKVVIEAFVKYIAAASTLPVPFKNMKATIERMTYPNSRRVFDLHWNAFRESLSPDEKLLNCSSPFSTIHFFILKANK